MDHIVFKALFESHYTSLCNLAYRIIGDLNKSEDIVQDVFVKLWNDRDKIDTARGIRSLVYTMVKNHTLEVLRREGIGARISQNLMNPAVEDDQAIEEDEIEKYKLIDLIYVSIRQLPPKCGEVFTLSKVNGLTYTQIADQLNISVKTVENHMGKALMLLREMISIKIN